MNRTIEEFVSVIFPSFRYVTETRLTVERAKWKCSVISVEDEMQELSLGNL